MNPAIIIPTYICAHPHVQRSGLFSTYDHMTPLNEPGELGTCLDSLQKVKGLGQVIILVASDEGIEAEAARKVQDICSERPGINTLVAGATELDLVRQRFEQLNIDGVDHEISLTGYSSIRNFGLVVANIFGFDAVVFIDDDEVVEDPEFLQKAMYGLGKLTRKNIPILAKSGYFIDAKGSNFSNSDDNRMWDQGRAFNQWMSKAMSGSRLSRANSVCGGCMALHREAYRRLSFDPWVPRGEDLDYMLNLRMYGCDIWFDNQWQLRHLPPANQLDGARFYQDTFRWLYEFRKIEYSRTQIDLMQVKPASLEPYPGPFLEADIANRLRHTAKARTMGASDKQGYRDAVKALKLEAPEYAENNCRRYFEFQFVWPELMARIEGDKVLSTALLKSMALRAYGAEMASRYDRGPAAAAGIDPGATGEIRLNLVED